MMKVLLLLLVTAAAATAAPRASLCPQDTDIYPCICSEEHIDQRVNLNMDCSNVTSNSVLASVFQAEFPITNFANLTISPKTSHPALTALDPKVFGEVSFVNILIDNTYIRTINEEALSPSHGTLIQLRLANNKIDTFPFETLSAFEHLRFLILANNKLPSLPNVESNSLLHVDLSRNVGLTFSHDTFSGSPELEILYLNNMGITTFPPNVFSSLKNLNIIDLSKNNLAGELGPGVIRVPLDSVGEELRLNDNHITQIDPTAITGVNRSVKIDFRNNDITSLDWNNWFPLLDQLNGVQVVDLRGNLLSCACDLVWLLLDMHELDKIHDDTTCFDGSRMKDTDVNDLLTIC